MQGVFDMFQVQLPPCEGPTEQFWEDLLDCVYNYSDNLEEDPDYTPDSDSEYDTESDSDTDMEGTDNDNNNN